MILNRLEVIEQKIGNTLVTSDTATIINNLPFIHPSAKIISLAALTQEQESGDSAGFVVLFATELLTKSYDLIKQGFSISTIIDSFEEALDICLDILETLAEYKISDISDILDGFLVFYTIDNEFILGAKGVKISIFSY
jgi:chaperonin GroEL (HSP60 family)